MNKKKILILGSIAYDYIMDYDENFLNAVSIDKAQGKYQSVVTASSRVCQFGGTAGNISYHIGKLGAYCDICGSVGKDFITLGYKEHLDKLENINQILEIYDDLFTAACFIVNDNSKNQMITFHGGALDKNVEFSLKSKIRDPNEYFFAINSVQSVPAMLHFASELEELNIPFIFDPGQVLPLFQPEDLIETIKKAHVLICNENEFSIIKQKTQLSDEELFDIIPIVIITKGEKGSFLYSKKQNLSCEIPSCKVDNVIDPTGAGDGYRSGFLTGLIKGMSLEDACKLGSIIGSFIIQSVGAQTPIYTLKDVKHRFKETYGYIPKELD
jgi:adenosine kinase